MAKLVLYFIVYPPYMYNEQKNRAISRSKDLVKELNGEWYHV